MPTILSVPPTGAMVGSALVPASPIMPARAARSVYQSIAPQWLELPSAAKAIPVPWPAPPPATSMARSMAKVPPIWPIVLAPSTRIAPPCLRDRAGDAFRVDPLAGQLADIVRDAQHAVRVDAAPVGVEKRLRQQPRVPLAHVAGREDARDEGLRRSGAAMRRSVSAFG